MMFLTYVNFIKRNPLSIMMIIIAACYCIGYWFHPAVPSGNAAYPFGWWGWFDQGKYHEGAQALYNFDLRGEKHYYAPLYPAIGALFLPFSKLHPYFFFNLACFVWIGYVFFVVASKYLPPLIAVLIFLATLVFDIRFFENFLIPWTTTLGAALLSCGIYVLNLVQNRLKEADSSVIGIPMRYIFFGSFTVGLITLTRPVDLPVGLILIAGVVGLVFYHVLRFDRRPLRQLTLTTCMALVGGMIGPILFIWFNDVAFGSPFGGYIQTNLQNGYYLADMGEKFVSIFLDGNALYLQNDTALVCKIPWLILSILAIPYLLIAGDFLIRVIVLVVCAQFFIYLPYGDLLPNSLWYFKNIHYFKWTIPYLALFSCLFILILYRQRMMNKRRLILGSCYVLTGCLLILMIKIHVNYYSFPPAVPSVSGSDGKPHSIDLIVDNQRVDIIDVVGLTGGYYEVYFGSHQLWADGRELKHIRDFRAMQMDKGIRIVMLLPLVANNIRFNADPRLKTEDSKVSTKVACYKIGFRDL